MSFARRLETLDRRWIFLIVGLLVLIPLIWPLPLPITVSPRVKDSRKRSTRFPTAPPS